MTIYQVKQTQPKQMLGEDGLTAIGTGEVIYGGNEPVKSFLATVSGTGAVTGTVLIKGTNDGVNTVTLGTITLSGTTSHTDGFSGAYAYLGYIADLTAISGTSAVAKVSMGYGE